jgi:hypothetical protein
MKTFTAVSGSVTASRKLCPNIWGKHGVREFIFFENIVGKLYNPIIFSGQYCKKSIHETINDVVRIQKWQTKKKKKKN